MSDNKKIAKNSLFLYLRLIVITIFGLITTRLVLQELGVDDYGLYAIVGGIVSMLGFINSAMLSTTYRFIAIEIGKKENGNINKVFNTALLIHIGLAIIFFLVVEIGGVWYIENYLNVDASRIDDALYVLHLTVITTVFTIVSVPFEGVITAKENFLFRTIAQTVQSLLRFILILVLTYYVGNKLRAYAVINVIASLVPLLIYFLYCYVRERSIIKWNLNRLKRDYFEMFKFAAWITIGAVAFIGSREGATILINLFFGTALNAAFGIASQIFIYVMTFVTNISQAAVPQIMKSHSDGNHVRSISLVYLISKYSFFVMLIPSLAIILSLQEILTLWLKKVPDHTVDFSVLLIISGLVSVVATGFDAAIQATGNIRRTQIWYSILILAALPISYILFKMGFPPFTIVVVNMIMTFINLIVQIKIMSQLTTFKIIDYYFKTIQPVLTVLVLIIPQFYLRHFFGKTMMDTLSASIFSVIYSIIVIYLAGLSKEEKQVIQIFLINLKTKTK